MRPETIQTVPDEGLVFFDESECTSDDSGLGELLDSENEVPWYN